MKKTYISPEAQAITFYTESLMTTTSLMQNDSEELGGGSALSTERNGWSADNWTGADED